MNIPIYESAAADESTNGYEYENLVLAKTLVKTNGKDNDRSQRATGKT